VARTVNQDYAMRRGEPLAECKPHIFQISARAVDQHDGGVGAGGSGWKAEHGHVQPHALDIDKLSSRRMRGLKLRQT
jgi:hypothetical protein